MKKHLLLRLNLKRSPSEVGPFARQPVGPFHFTPAVPGRSTRKPWMFRTGTLLRKSRGWFSMFALLFICLVPADVRGETGTANFDKVGIEVLADLKAAESEKARLVDEVSRERGKMQGERAAIEKGILREKAGLAEARSRLAVVDGELQGLLKQVSSEQGNLDQLADAARTSAAEILSLARRLPVTAEEPEQLKDLENCMDKGRFPGLEDIDTLLRICFNELDAGGRIWVADGQFVNEQGEDANGRILFLGGITAAYEDIAGNTGYLTLGPQTGRLIAAARPPWMVRHNLREYIGGRTGSVFADISAGAALQRLAQSVSVWQQFLSGGPLIWPIVLVGMAALVLIVERILFLRRIRANTDDLMANVTRLIQANDFEAAIAESNRHKGQPTGNVLLAGLQLKGKPRDVIESSLSEAIVKEMPRLERFLPVLKMLAGVAPLLGLLGTVTGMIGTFQVITIFGSGDPKLMSGGISEALVTTELGLGVAIPIVIATTLLTQRVRGIVSDMQEKAMALTAVLLQEQG